MRSKDCNILFVDLRATNSRTGGGSSQSLKLLISSLIDKGQENLNILETNFNKEYLDKNYNSKIKRFSIKFPNVFGKYNRELMKIGNLFKLIFMLPILNVQYYSKIKKNDINTIIYNESRAFLTFYLANLVLRLNNNIQIITYIRGEKSINDTFSTLVIKGSTKIIVLADYMYDLIKQKKKVYVLSNGVHLEPYNPEIKIEIGLTQIICVGTLTPLKGQKDLIQALIGLDKNIRDKIHVTFLGDKRDSKFLNELNNLIEENNLHNIVFAGEQKNIQSWYKSSDIIIHPSYYEGVPRVLLESSNYPIVKIVSAIPGNEEVIKDNFNGYTYKLGEISSLSNLIINVMNLNEHEKIELYKNGWDLINNKFNIEENPQKFLHILGE